MTKIYLALVWFCTLLLPGVVRAEDAALVDPARLEAPPTDAPGFPSRDPPPDALPGLKGDRVVRMPEEQSFPGSGSFPIPAGG